MRPWLAALVGLCGCDQLFSLDEVKLPPPPDATPDAAPPALASWTSTTDLPAPRDYNHMHAAVVGGTLYMIGGFDGNVGEVATVLAAPLTLGSVGAWTPTSPLPAPRALGDVVTIGSRIYVVGGANGGGAQQSVYFTTASDGALSPWAATSELPAPTKAHAAATSGNFLYMIGGADVINTRLATVYVASIEPTGMLGPWEPTTPLPSPRANHGGIAARGFIYALGGDESDATSFTTVFFGPLDPMTGQVLEWKSTTPLPVARKGLVALTDGIHIYIVGGRGTTNSSEVRFATIAEDGTLSAWETTSPLLMPRFRHAAVLADGQLVVLGGDGTPLSVEITQQGPS